MAKLTLSDVVNLQNEQTAISTINANSALIEAALENTLSRDGTTPNSMGADLDMNSNQILNLPAPTSDTEPLRLGDLPDILPTFIVQNDEPATSFTTGSIWIDSNSADYDVYQLVGGVWTDTGIDLEGVQGDPGTPGDDGALWFVQNDAPSTNEPNSSLWIDADSLNQDLYQLVAGVWTDTGLDVKGTDGTMSGPMSSTDHAIARYAGTDGTTVQNSGITIDDSDNIEGINNVTGVDTNLVTGTAGTSGNLSQWNSDGDLVDGPAASLVTGALQQGIHEVWIDATAMTPKATNGAAFTDYDSGASDVTMKVLAFDTTTQEYAHFKMGMPKGWNEGTVTFIPYWTATSGTNGNNVVWTLAGRALGNDDAINGAFGTAQSSDDAKIANNDLHIGPTSSAITIGNTPAENDLVVFEVSRDVANDNLAADALLIGIKLRITTNAANDA